MTIMGRYGNAAVKATRLYHDRQAATPNEAWEIAVREIFIESTALQHKGCPRNAYLGLCENGDVVGIEEGNYCRSKKNKDYAIQALSQIKQDPTSAWDERTLWDAVMEGAKKVHNHQMDVVLVLWKAGLILHG